MLHTRHCVFIGNWYTFTVICHVFNNTITDVVGTLRRDHKRLPDSVVKKNLKQGEKII